MSSPTSPRALEAWAAMDAALYVGQAVRVRWTSTGRYYEAHGVVTTLNQKTVLVALASTMLDPYDGHALYPAGQTIKVARFPFRGWSPNNTVDIPEGA